MTLPQALNECLVRPELMAVLDPRRVIRIAATGVLLDATKVGRSYPRLTVQDLCAATWQVFTAEQLDQRAAAIAAELEARGIAVND
jgi:hypothetical protein